MKIDAEVQSVISTLGTIGLLALLIDRAYRLALRWLEAGRPDIFGPKPLSIRAGRLAPAAGDRTTQQREDSTKWN